MKNKEIEELLNDIKTHDYKVINKEDYVLLLSYIEQLEKTIKVKDEGIKAFTQDLCETTEKLEQLEADYKEASESVTWWQNRYIAIVKQNDDNHKKVVKLENNRDKAFEYLKEKADYPISYYHCIRETIDILKGDSDDTR